MTKILFQNYIKKFDRKILEGRKVFLFDNCPTHPNINEDLKNIELFFFPPNISSKI